MVLPTSSKSSTVSTSIHPKSAALIGATNLCSCTPLRSRPFIGAVVTSIVSMMMLMVFAVTLAVGITCLKAILISVLILYAGSLPDWVS